METITLQKLEKAFAIKDPELAKMFVRLVTTNPQPKKPVKEGCLTYQSFLRELNAKKYKADRDHFRQENLKLLESEAEYLPERLKVDKLLMQLWQENSSYSRMCLFEIIAKVPLVWGPWRALKQIFKEAELKNDTEVFGALCARFDCEFASFSRQSEVSKATLRYLVRRGWRYLRKTGQNLSACYLDCVVDVLKFYPQHTNWRRTWIVNHIFFHNSGKYTRRKFHSYFKQNFLADRAFADLWQRSPRPLFNLLEEAKSDYVCQMVISALKKDFVADLREVEAVWIIRLLEAKREILDEFAVWLLTTIPKFEQSTFRDLGLHQPILNLLCSSASTTSTFANKYACKYARTYARDLPISDLLLLANNNNKEVNKLVIDLLQDRHPRNDVGLEAWGRLLEFEHYNEFVTKILREHFGAKELTPEWFKSLLLNGSYYSLRFVEKNLLEVHSRKSLTATFFCDMFLEEKLAYDACDFCLNMLDKFDKKDIDIEFVKIQLLNPLSKYHIVEWLREEKVKVEDLGVEYLKALAYHAEWEKSPWVQELKNSHLEWCRGLNFNDYLLPYAQEWLSDVRKFSASDIGFEWLFELVQRKEQHYHDFASAYLTKAFVPADFAAKKATKKTTKKAAKKSQANFKEQTFLFTGKLKTMTRGEATKKVTAANGKNASGVSANLNYLVIGDEGSSLYGEGRKGSKQVKAEKLIAGGAETKIISETAFLQMLSGKTVEHSTEDSTAGCEVIWQYLFSGKDEDSPLARFAKSYIERHHPHISLKLTDRPVDPGAEIPESFLTFERLQQLVSHERKGLRELGLEILHWELARLQPDIYEIVKVCEQSYPKVTEFFTRALTVEDSKEHKTYRLDPKILKADAVYQLCESPQEQARALGMQLIHHNPHLAIPEELFRLTESTDRRVLSFVVEIMWKLYYEKGTTISYTQNTDKDATKQKKLRDKSQTLPAAQEMLNDFLRRMLFRISPAKFAKDVPADDSVHYTSFRKVKLRIIEVMRDIALKNKEFARLIVPLFEEFAASHGQSEKSACLVALARIGHVFDEFQVLVKG